MKKLYDSSLDLLKKTFIGSEGKIWIDEVKRNFPISYLRLLDIGIGTGESINKRILPLIHEGYHVELHGVDPIVSVEAVRQNVCSSVMLYSQTFEEYLPDINFDIVNATQSLYYLSDLEDMLTKMKSLTKEGGLLISTLWSKSCILYQLHKAMFGEQSNCITAEDVYCALSNMSGLEEIKLIRHEGFVNIDYWKQHSELQYAALNIISRQLTDSSISVMQMQRFVDILQIYHGNLLRVNYVIVAKKLF